MPATTLSVIVPCRDAARHLPVALAAAQRNDDEGTEWLLVDDGSTDATPRLLAAFRPMRGRVRVLTMPEPSGVVAARAAALREAAGRYVTFVDADDWLAPGHLPAMVAAIRRLDVDFVRCDHLQVTGTRRSLRRVPEGRRDRPLPAHEGIGTRPGTLSAVDAPNLWAGVYDRRLADRGLLDVDPAIRTAEDRMTIWRLHLHADRFAVVDAPGYRYRREVAGSLTAIGDERQLHFFDAYEAVGRDLDADPALERFRPKLVRCVVDLVAHHEVSRARLHPLVHRRFRARARATLRGLPAPLVRQAVATLVPERVAALRGLA
ncbi:glycosyltransferase family 2 protein [Amnibacterium endophyticum]|uniref:Glycosyltransferase family 2 protein n=1 Tax=Amnibacterium endophyticum TaxID=2109337 RepID=A0ABW4LCV1_9MICO